MITLDKLNSIGDKVTAFILLKTSFNLEAIIRCLIDREYDCDKFEETKKFYVFYAK